MSDRGVRPFYGKVGAVFSTRLPTAVFRYKYTTNLALTISIILGVIYCALGTVCAGVLVEDIFNIKHLHQHQSSCG